MGNCALYEANMKTKIVSRQQLKDPFLPALSAVLALGMLSPAEAALVIAPAAGHVLTWDGNDGDYHDNVSIPAQVPFNAALGGTPFAANDPSAFPVPHVVTNLNDGFYGNTSAHINGSGGLFMGVMLPSMTQINTIAFGRDNGTPAPGDCCSGQLIDRAVAIYTLQYTADSGTTWIDIGNLDYSVDGGDLAPGGTFDPFLRHQYDVATDAGPIMGDGVRIVFTDTGTAIDEIEINTVSVPEPSGVSLLGLGLAGVLLRRRRSGAPHPSSSHDS
ncbi:MAG: hypothetical protein ACJAQT_004866 [Akkermansiaceae bacterium]|jgi:hypothetical protein